MPISEELTRVFAAAQRLVEISFETWTPAPKFMLEDDLAPGNPALVDRRDQAPNPFFHQTHQGLILRLQYGRPWSIWTPWGEWECWGACRADLELSMRFLERLGLEGAGKMELYVATFPILEVEERKLPQPHTRSKSEFLGAEALKAQWAELVQARAAEHVRASA